MRRKSGEKASNIILPALDGSMFELDSLKGSLTTMPADFLVDENGVIRTAYYGKDEGDHLPFEQARAFSLAAKNVKNEHRANRENREGDLT